MWHAVPGLGVELDKPVIAATSGWVVGGGFVLVQMADMCVASETTRFSYPEGKVGTTGGGISSVLARMPHKIAMEFLLVGEEMSAERAYQIGFVNKVVPKGQHVAHAQAMAAKIAAAAPLVVQALKKLARDAMPKGPLERVAEVRRLLDPCGTAKTSRKASRRSAKSASPSSRAGSGHSPPDSAAVVPSQCLKNNLKRDVGPASARSSLARTRQKGTR